MDMTKEKIKIHKNVEIPEKGSKRSKYPLRELDIGDGFFVPCDDNYQHTVRSTIYSHAKRIGIRVTMRRCFEDSGWGLWVKRVHTQEDGNENHKSVQPAGANDPGG
jgi:hypothetical protein